MTNLTITEAERTEMIILVRMELQHLDELGQFDQEGYEQWRQRRVEIMNVLLDKLMEEA